MRADPLLDRSSQAESVTVRVAPIAWGWQHPCECARPLSPHHTRPDWLRILDPTPAWRDTPGATYLGAVALTLAELLAAMDAKQRPPSLYNGPDWWGDNPVGRHMKGAHRRMEAAPSPLPIANQPFIVAPRPLSWSETGP
jgi:hypothetical protein